MKKMIAVFLVLSLVFLAGCGPGKAAHVKGVPAMTGPSAPDGAGLSAEASLENVEADLAEIDSLDEDLYMSDLDALDAELNFEI